MHKVEIISPMTYQLLDSGNGLKLEAFGKVVLIRPAPQALWQPQLSQKEWAKAHASFTREGKSGWQMHQPLPTSWTVTLEGIRLHLKRTDFGHLGVFPEHAHFWPWLQKECLTKTGIRVLNLFAYSGGATLALAKCGAQVTHLDAAKGMCDWASENARLNGLEKAPIRWIVDDARKYLARACKRGERYEGIVLDPPSFGRGKAGEIFKIEHDLPLILKQCRELLSDSGRFILFTCHTPGFTPLVMSQLLKETFAKGEIDSGEMFLDHPTFKLPSGSFAKGRFS